MDASSDDVERAEAIYAHACDLYEGLADSLAEVIAALRLRLAEGPALTREETATLKTHQQAMLQVIEYENQLLQRHGPARGAGAPLDLDAAREEVARRLDRLAAALGA